MRGSRNKIKGELNRAILKNRAIAIEFFFGLQSHWRVEEGLRGLWTINDDMPCHRNCQSILL